MCADIYEMKIEMKKEALMVKKSLFNRHFLPSKPPFRNLAKLPFNKSMIDFKNCQ